MNFIFADHPRLMFAKTMHLFFRPPGLWKYQPAGICGGEGVHGRDVSIGPMAVVEDNVTIGSRVMIHPHAVIGRGVTIGDDVTVYPNVTILERCVIGSRVVIHSGTVIGSDGYGFVPDGERHFKIPQLGIVQIDDDVEIGACNTIDRATFGRTWIRSGVKTDNHVQIAHNVEVGENTLIVAQVGIAGSAKIGRNAILAGQAGIAGHITVGNRSDGGTPGRGHPGCAGWGSGFRNP
ncbi:MAG: UDP-3-O-(3-hydroxymyristoyl)glucosamine N-acyltransferase [Desulfobacterales bacterium]